MILKVALFFSALGFVTWVIGLAFRRPVLVVIGGVLIVGLGASVMTQGLAYKSGETREAVSNNTTVVEHEYKQVEPADKFPLSMVVMLLGAVGVYHGMDAFG